MTKPKKHPKVKPTNQFCVPVTIDFPHNEQTLPLVRWFNLQNCGKEILPITEKATHQHQERAFNLYRSRAYTFVFEIDAEGEWKFIGRKA